MIRKIQRSDIERVMRIWLDGNMDAHPFIPKKYWESNFESVREQISRAAVFVYELHGEIQGFIGIVDAYIAGIFVYEKHRSHGIGKKLLDYVKPKYSSLSLSVYKKNNRAAVFYLREGFTLQSEKPDESTSEVEYTMLWKTSDDIPISSETDSGLNHEQSYFIKRL